MLCREEEEEEEKKENIIQTWHRSYPERKSMFRYGRSRGMMIILMTIDADSLVVFVYSLIYLVFFTIHIPIVFRTYLWQNPPPPPLSLSRFSSERERENKRDRNRQRFPKKTY